MEEQRDGRSASDVGGVAAREDADEELRGEVEEAGGRRRGWRGRGGGGLDDVSGASQEKEFSRAIDCMRNNDKTKARAEEREKNIGWIKRLFTA